MKNQYGKSAVDATRRNTLPLYLDKVLSQSSSTVFELSLPSDGWIEREDGLFYQYAPVNPDDYYDDVIAIVSPAEGYQVRCALHNILGEYDEEHNILALVADKKPTVQIKILLTLFGSLMEDVLPVADATRF